MKKSLLALAVLTAITGAASAQSSVTLYGKVDLGLTMDSGAPHGAGKSVRIDSGVTGGSRIGFKGVEDLGGGYKAAFQLETGYCADGASGASTPNFCTGSNQFMGRQAHGDLTGAFGAMSAGRQYSLGFNNLSTLDPFGTGFAGQVNNIVDPSGTRLNNSFTYTTPSVYGFNASGEIALGEQTGGWKKNREVGGALTYASGPAYVGFTFYDLDNANGSGNARKNYLLGGTYDFSVVKLHLMAQKSTGNPTTATGGAMTRINSMDYMGGLTVPVLGGSLMASYVRHNDRTSSAEQILTTNAGITTGYGDRDADQFGVGYQYPLSKRTSIYGAFAKIQERHGASSQYFTVGNATAAGTGDKAFNLGVVHNF